MTAKELSVRAEFEQLGFVETDTGGGCTAWVMELSHNRTCAVDTCDLAAPVDMDDPVELVIYHGGCCVQIGGTINFDNTSTLFDWIDALRNDGESAATAISRWAGEQ